MRSLRTLLIFLGAVALPYPAWADPPRQIPPANDWSKEAGMEVPGSGRVCKNGNCAEAAPAADGPNFLVFGDLLLWNVHGAGVPFAQPFDRTGPLGVPTGGVEVAHPEFKGGFRAGAGMALSDHSWLVGTFTYFRDSINDRLAAPDGNILQANVVFPNTVNGAFLPMTADAHYDIRLWSGDLDYECAIICNDHMQLTWLAGVRYAHVAQNFTVNYAVFGTTTVDTHIGFDGIGPRAGLEGEYKIGGGFFGFGKGIVNTLAGRFRAQYFQGNTFVTQQAQTQINDDRLVPILEAELGFGWQSPKGHIRIAAGYYVGSWFNALTTPTLIQGVQSNNFTTNGNNFRDTLTFDGLFARLELRY